MSKISVNFGSISETNAKMLRYIANASDVKRELNILRWKLDREILDNEGMNSQLYSIMHSMDKIISDMDRVQKTVSDSVSQYKRNESELLRKIDASNKFL